jgi:hypothetical protein
MRYNHFGMLYAHHSWRKQRFVISVLQSLETKTRLGGAVAVPSSESSYQSWQPAGERAIREFNDGKIFL